MFDAFFSAAQMRAEETVKRGVFSLAAVLVAIVGLCFLASAGWLFVADLHGAIVASLALGGVSLVVALVFALIARRRRMIVSSPVITPVTGAGRGEVVVMAPVLAQAFVTGLTVGLKGAKQRD